MSSTALVLLLAACCGADAEPLYRSELIFPLHPKHNHAPGVAELPGGELFRLMVPGIRRAAGGRRCRLRRAIEGRRDGVVGRFPAGRHAGIPRLQHLFDV